MTKIMQQFKYKPKQLRYYNHQYDYLIGQQIVLYFLDSKIQGTFDFIQSFISKINQVPENYYAFVTQEFYNSDFSVLNEIPQLLNFNVLMDNGTLANFLEVPALPVVKIFDSLGFSTFESHPEKNQLRGVLSMMARIADEHKFQQMLRSSAFDESNIVNILIRFQDGSLHKQQIANSAHLAYRDATHKPIEQELELYDYQDEQEKLQPECYKLCKPRSTCSQKRQIRRYKPITDLLHHDDLEVKIDKAVFTSVYSDIIQPELQELRDLHDRQRVQVIPTLRNKLDETMAVIYSKTFTVKKPTYKVNTHFRAWSLGYVRMASRVEYSYEGSDVKQYMDHFAPNMRCNSIRYENKPKLIGDHIFVGLRANNKSTANVGGSKMSFRRRFDQLIKDEK